MKIRIVRKTDQWNNEDFTDGSRVFTISHVTEGREQAPYDIHFSDGDGKCWRPSNGMLELLVNLWGNEAQAWTGHKVELFRDPGVKIGRDVVGGIRVRSLSHIDKPMAPLITVSRGTKKPYAVKPLQTATPPVDASQIDAALTAITNATTTGQLDAITTHATNIGIHEHIQDAIEQKRAQLNS